jgi:hypothetical protein
MNNDITELLILQQKQFFYSTTIKLIIAGLMCLGGFFLLILGISGSVEIEVNAMDIQGKLINASPGIVFVFLGMLIILKTHHKSHQTIEQHENGIIKTAGLSVAHGMVINSKTGTVVTDQKLSKEYYKNIKK